MSQTASNPPNKPFKLRAIIDSRSLPIACFGKGTSRHIRKLVYNYLATYSNPDGTSSCPSLTTIARDCGLSRSGAISTIQWLEEFHLLRIRDERSRFNTNDYTVLFSEDDQRVCLEELAKNEEEQEIAGSKEKTRIGRQKGGRNAAAKRRAKAASSLSEQPSTPEIVAPMSDQELIAPMSNQPSSSGAQMVAREHFASRSLEQSDRPSLPSLNRQRPSILPSTDGGKDGALDSSDQNQETSECLLDADSLARWASDMIYAKSYERHYPSAGDCRRFERIESEIDLGEAAIAVYQFCLRPKGLCGLVDAFGAFWREWSAHLGDAQTHLKNDSVGSVIERLHDEAFRLEDSAGEQNRYLPSMGCKRDVYAMLGLKPEPTENERVVTA